MAAMYLKLVPPAAILMMETSPSMQLRAVFPVMKMSPPGPTAIPFPTLGAMKLENVMSAAPAAAGMSRATTQKSVTRGPMDE
jgi:hypothetical protein